MNNGGQEQEIKIWWRHWSVVLILAILAGFIIWSMVNFGSWLRDWQERMAVSAAKKRLEAAYQKDRYGGTTPEETFEMFLSAIEKNDIVNASRFFVIEKQEQWNKTLNEYKNKTLLKSFVSELLSDKSRWKKIDTDNKDMAKYDYQVMSGAYTSSVIFKKYPSGIWKISDL